MSCRETARSKLGNGNRTLEARFDFPVSIWPYLTSIFRYRRALVVATCLSFAFLAMCCGGGGGSTSGGGGGGRGGVVVVAEAVGLERSPLRPELQPAESISQSHP